MPCKPWFKQLDQVNSDLRRMRLYGLVPTDPLRRELWKVRGALMGRVGLRSPRTITQMIKLFRLSPGTLTLWYDIEGGLMVEARASEGAMPVYHYIDIPMAIRIQNNEITHDEFVLLLQEEEVFMS